MFHPLSCLICYYFYSFVPFCLCTIFLPFLLYHSIHFYFLSFILILSITITTPSSCLHSCPPLVVRQSAAKFVTHRSPVQTTTTTRPLLPSLNGRILFSFKNKNPHPHCSLFLVHCLSLSCHSSSEHHQQYSQQFFSVSFL